MKIREKDTSIETKREEMGMLFDTDNKSQYLITYLINTSEDDLKILFDKANLTLANILSSGLSEKDFDNKNIDYLQ